MNKIKELKGTTLFALVFIIILISSGISVYATYSYFSSDVSYTRNNITTNVANALDDLYNRTTELSTLTSLINQTDATENDIQNGKKAYSNGELITGIANLDKDWTLVITYKIYLGWNGNNGYGYQNGKTTIKNVNGNKTITNENGTITSPTESWNGNYYINAKIADVAIESFTIDN